MSGGIITQNVNRK